jgi:hypothetical protein
MGAGGRIEKLCATVLRTAGLAFLAYVL